MPKLSYNTRKLDGSITLKQGAAKAGVSYSRFRKALQRLKIPVKRAGWMILVPSDAPAKVKRAMQDGTIKPGRKPATRKGATA